MSRVTRDIITIPAFSARLRAFNIPKSHLGNHYDNCRSDTVACWRSLCGFFLRWESKYIKPVKQCIQEFGVTKGRSRLFKISIQEMYAYTSIIANFEHLHVKMCELVGLTMKIFVLSPHYQYFQKKRSTAALARLLRDFMLMEMLFMLMDMLFRYLFASHL